MEFEERETGYAHMIDYNGKLKTRSWNPGLT